jgi:ATP-dependent Lon protease
MNPTVLAALIGAVSAIVVQIISQWQQNSKRRIEEAARDAKLEERLKTIERKLDEHNGYAGKITSIQTDIAFIRGKMQSGG